MCNSLRFWGDSRLSSLDRVSQPITRLASLPKPSRIVSSVEQLRTLLLVHPFEQPVFFSECDGPSDVSFRDIGFAAIAFGDRRLVPVATNRTDQHLTSFATTEQVLETSAWKYHYSSHRAFEKGLESDEDGIQRIIRL